MTKQQKPSALVGGVVGACVALCIVWIASVSKYHPKIRSLDTNAGELRLQVLQLQQRILELEGTQIAASPDPTVPCETQDDVEEDHTHSTQPTQPQTTQPQTTQPQATQPQTSPTRSFTRPHVFSVILNAANAGAYKSSLSSQLGCHGDTEGRAFVTLCTNHQYIGGVLMIAKALQAQHSRYPLIVMVTESCDSFGARVEFAAVSARTCPVAFIPNPHPPKQGHYFTDTYNKVNVFALPLTTALFLDADILPLRGMDSLFDKLTENRVVAATCDSGRSSTFNSGLMVIAPQRVDFADMISKIQTLVSADSGDQGFINSYINGNKACTAGGNTERFVGLEETDEWERTKTSRPSWSVLHKWMQMRDYTQYEPHNDLIRSGIAEMDNIEKIRAVHFLGWPKPWLHCKNEKECDTNIGRGNFMDLFYMHSMNEFGLKWGELGPTGRGILSETLSLELIQRRCPQHTATSTPAYHTAVLCENRQKKSARNACYDGPHKGKYLAGCFDGCRMFSTLKAAEEACSATQCGGVTQVAENSFELRRDGDPRQGKESETSWKRVTCAETEVESPPQSETESKTPNSDATSKDEILLRAWKTVPPPEEQMELTNALLNFNFESCTARCVFSLRSPDKSWEWIEDGKCWKPQQTACGGQQVQAKGSFATSQLYLASAQQVCDAVC